MKPPHYRFPSSTPLLQKKKRKELSLWGAKPENLLVPLPIPCPFTRPRRSGRGQLEPTVPRAGERPGGAHSRLLGEGSRMGEQIIGVRSWFFQSWTLTAHSGLPAGLLLNEAWRSLSCLDNLFLMQGVDRDNKRSEQSKDALRGEF